ncbi:MAG TPA: 2-dehydropantoate 2-reductase [Vicinamibacterales bacterium]|nr:2-dehydropantoate 2-reductase [Vicinamibacterales bacterium]
MAMHFAIVGSGAVGGFYGALLHRAGSDVTFLARGAHLEAMRTNGLRVAGPTGDFTVRARTESRAGDVGPVDVVLLAVKTYDNDTALPMLGPLTGPDTVVLTLQNGVDSPEQVAAVVGERATLAGPTYIATAVEAPGVIRQTGTHRRIVFGEYFGDRVRVSDRVRAIETVMRAADIHAEAVADARVPVWEKFVYLAPFAAFTAAARLPIGPLWEDEATRNTFLAAVAEVEAVARASGVAIDPQMLVTISEYVTSIPPATRSSMLIDLSQGKRIEVESLAGSVVRRGRALGVPTPMLEALYAVLRPHSGGQRAQ